MTKLVGPSIFLLTSGVDWFLNKHDHEPGVRRCELEVLHMCEADQEPDGLRSQSSGYGGPLTIMVKILTNWFQLDKNSHESNSPEGWHPKLSSSFQSKRQLPMTRLDVTKSRQRRDYTLNAHFTQHSGTHKTRPWEPGTVEFDGQMPWYMRPHLTRASSSTIENHPVLPLGCCVQGSGLEFRALG